jgi:hypothetical protein
VDHGARFAADEVMRGGVMNASEIAPAAVSVLTSLAAVVGLVNRKNRRRASILANLELLKQIHDAREYYSEDSTTNLLQQRVSLDVALLAGAKLVNKTPIPWGGVVFSALSGLGFAWLTYYLNVDRFNWFSILTGTLSFLMFMSFYGQFINREIPEEVPPEDQEITGD